MTAILYSLAAPSGLAADSAAAPRNSRLEGMRDLAIFWLLFGRARGRRRRDALTAQVAYDVAVVLVLGRHQVHHALHGINLLVAHRDFGHGFAVVHALQCAVAIFERFDQSLAQLRFARERMQMVRIRRLVT